MHTTAKAPELVSRAESSTMPRGYRWALFAAASLATAIQLFVPPILGVADNGDYEKLSRHACIGPESLATDFDYFEPRFTVRKAYCGSIINSSATIPLFLSLIPARLLLTEGRYDLRFLGATYAVMFLGAIWPFLRVTARATPIAREVVATVFVFIFCSAVYLPLFNSFYMDAAAFLYLLWAVLFGICVLTATRVKWPQYIALGAAVLLLATSKLQYATLAFCFLPIFWFRAGRATFPRLWIRISVTGAILVGTIFYVRSASPWYQAINLYDGLFFKFLPASSDPAAEIRDLGLDPQFIQYIGQHSYSPGTHMQEEGFALAFGRIITTPKVAWWILTHRPVAFQALVHDLDEGSLERVRMKIGSTEYRLGNYERTAGHPPNSQSSFLTLWSKCKLALYKDRPWIFLGYILLIVAGLFAAALYQPTDRGRALAGVISLSAMLPAAFIPPFFDAVDTGRHLFLFNALLDLCVCALLWLVLRGYRVRRRRSMEPEQSADTVPQAASGFSKLLFQRFRLLLQL